MIDQKSSHHHRLRDTLIVASKAFIAHAHIFVHDNVHWINCHLLYACYFMIGFILVSCIIFYGFEYIIDAYTQMKWHQRWGKKIDSEEEKERKTVYVTLVLWPLLRSRNVAFLRNTNFFIFVIHRFIYVSKNECYFDSWISHKILNESKHRIQEMHFDVLEFGVWLSRDVCL